MGLLSKEICPVCGKQIGMFTKSMAKYNKAHLCQTCCTNIGKACILVIGLDKYSLTQLQTWAGVGKATKDNEVIYTEYKYSIGNSNTVTTTKVNASIANINKLKECFIAVDVETNGLSSSVDKIIEIGAVKFVNGNPVETFASLVNANCNIPASATKVNHITNEMIRRAPGEESVFETFMNFIGDARNGIILMCAHNASFDFGFLKNTLERLGYDADFCYVDTLGLARKYLPTLENHKQATVAAHFGIENTSEHRAGSDAKACGQILVQLLDCAEQIDKKEYNHSSNSNDVYDPGSEIFDNELEVCAVIQDILARAGKNLDMLRFRKNKSGYVEILYLYSFVKFKFSKKGKFIILDKSARNITELPVEECTINEGGKDNVRIYFSNPKELSSFESYIIDGYNQSLESSGHYLKYANRNEIDRWMSALKSLTKEEVKKLVESISNKQYEDVTATVSVEQVITRDMVSVNAIHSRCPLSEVKNLSNEYRAIEKGLPYYELGEKKRLNGEYEEAIALYDQARYQGYSYPVLYEAYAKAYGKLKDYENIIVLMEEYLNRTKVGNGGRIEARLDKAIKALYKEQEASRKKEEKRFAKEQQLIEKEKANLEPAKPRGRAIIQLNDDGEVICEYESVSLAVNTTGINSKSIRDAAKGIQKHAGGYCWRYKDE